MVNSLIYDIIKFPKNLSEIRLNNALNRASEEFYFPKKEIYNISHLPPLFVEALQDKSVSVDEKLKGLKRAKKFGFKFIDGRLWHNMSIEERDDKIEEACDYVELILKLCFLKKAKSLSKEVLRQKRFKGTNKMSLNCKTIWFLVEIVCYIAEAFPDFDHKDFSKEFNYFVDEILEGVSNWIEISENR